ncbi:MAG: SRPBCC domain-containing protein [Gemmatimonadetes bacterium]|nr:SRPBCC domain-containing protein [Gemmatimonadota bacterium]
MAFQLTVKRVIKAPRGRVFRAWTDPEQIKGWWLPPGWENPMIEVDLKVGGTFRFGMRQPGKQMFYAVGTFTEIRPPERVVCTWRWEPAAMFDLDPGETRLTVEFKERGPDTEMTLIHERIATEKERNDNTKGWEECIERLARLVA